MGASHCRTPWQTTRTLRRADMWECGGTQDHSPTRCATTHATAHPTGAGCDAVGSRTRRASHAEQRRTHIPAAAPADIGCRHRCGDRSRAAPAAAAAAAGDEPPLVPANRGHSGCGAAAHRTGRPKGRGGGRLPQRSARPGPGGRHAHTPTRPRSLAPTTQMAMLAAGVPATITASPDGRCCALTVGRDPVTRLHYRCQHPATADGVFCAIYYGSDAVRTAGTVWDHKGATCRTCRGVAGPDDPHSQTAS